MRKHTILMLGLFTAAVATVACDSDDDDGADGDDSTDGDTNGSDTEGDDHTHDDSDDHGDTGTDTGDGTGSGDDSDTDDGGDYTEEGVCIQAAEGTVTLDSFVTVETRILVADGGLGDNICEVQFDVNRVSAGQAGCDECEWTHTVQYSNPVVLTDVDGVCGNSERGLDEAAIAEIDGSEVSVGFAAEVQGHGGALMTYDPATETWFYNGSASWDPDTGEFSLNNRQGFCFY